MKVVISAGGTGGHIYPAIAIINKIKEEEPNSEILYIGTHNRMEKDIVPKHGIPFKSIEMYGFNRKKILKNFKTLSCLLKGISECKKIIKEFKPDVVIGVGGYITVPVIYAANKLGVKTFIHEQNSVAGKANLSLAKKADLIGVSFESSINDFPKDKTIFTGNPCSESARSIKPCDKKEFGLDPKKKLVLIVMGSLGSSKMNEHIINAMKDLGNKSYEVVFVTGKDSYDDVIKNKFPDNVKIFPYIENMARLMKKTDVIVSRAGASTLSEIIALKLPSILVPSPYVPNNHQYKNAQDLVNNESTILLEEKDFNTHSLIESIDAIINNPEKEKQIKKNLEKLDTGNSATIIYENIKKLVDRK